MRKTTIVFMSLEEARARRVRGAFKTRSDAPVDPPLGNDFWRNAVLVEPANRKSAHLRLAPDVFEFFVKQTGGKGHIAKMQAVIEAHADAHS